MTKAPFGFSVSTVSHEISSQNLLQWCVFGWFLIQIQCLELLLGSDRPSRKPDEIAPKKLTLFFENITRWVVQPTHLNRIFKLDHLPKSKGENVGNSQGKPPPRSQMPRVSRTSTDTIGPISWSLFVKKKSGTYNGGTKTYVRCMKGLCKGNPTPIKQPFKVQYLHFLHFLYCTWILNLLVNSIGFLLFLPLPLTIEKVVEPPSPKTHLKKMSSQIKIGSRKPQGLELKPFNTFCSTTYSCL